MALAPQDLRVLKASLGSLDLWGRGDQLAHEASQASKAQRAALALEGQGDSKAPKEMWGPQDQKGPQGLQGPWDLRESQGLQGKQGYQASGGLWGLRVNQASRVPLVCLGPQAHQEARALTEKGPWPRHCHTQGDGGSEHLESLTTSRRLWCFDSDVGVSPWLTLKLRAPSSD